MYSIIVMSHGKLAEGLQDTLHMIAGPKEGVHFVTFEPTDTVEEFEKKVEAIFQSVPKEEDVLFLGDLYGGTPTNVATRYLLCYPERVQVVTGINFPFLLTAVLMREKNLGSDLDHIILESQQQLKKIEKVTLDNHEDDE